MRRRTRELLDGLGLSLDPTTLVRQCQLAEQQLIEVAKALSMNVRILVMDEPTSALADAEVRRLFAVIRDLVGRGVAVIYISHRLEELEEFADSVTCCATASTSAPGRCPRRPAAELIADDGRATDRRAVPRRPRTRSRPTNRRLDVVGLDLAPDAQGSYMPLHDINLRCAPARSSAWPG